MLYSASPKGGQRTTHDRRPVTARDSSESAVAAGGHNFIQPPTDFVS